MNMGEKRVCHIFTSKLAYTLLNKHLWDTSYMKTIVGIESPSKRANPSQTIEESHILNIEAAIDTDSPCYSEGKVVNVHVKQAFYCQEDCAGVCAAHTLVFT